MLRSCRLGLAAVVLLFAALSAHAATFLDQLTPDQKRRLGLDQLTPAQQADLNTLIEQYRKDGAVTAAKEAAATAVAEYRKKEEPGVVSRALDLFRRKQEQAQADAQQMRFTATIRGKFSGWDGRTLFHLDNGQVWKQSNSDVYAINPAENVAVLVYKARSGHWRLQLIEEGAWVTVKRVQ